MAHAIAVDATIKQDGQYLASSQLRVQRRLIGYGRVHNPKTAAKIESLEIQSRVFDPKFPLCNLKSVTFGRNDVVLDELALSYTDIEHVELPANSCFLKGAFRGCKKLTSANIPSRMDHIPDGAFGNDINLTSLRIDGAIEYMGAGCLYDCNQLDFKIPETVTVIGDAAMAGLANRELVIPYMCETVGDMAFGNMMNLKHVVVENPITKINTSAFWNCGNIVGAQIAGKSYAVKYVSPTPYLILGSECIHGINIMTLVHISGNPDAGRHFYYIPTSKSIWADRDEAIRFERRCIMKNYYKNLAKSSVDSRLNISVQELYCIGHAMPELEKPVVKRQDCDKCQTVHPAIYQECMKRYFNRTK